MVSAWLWVGLGGALGSMLRYGTGLLLAPAGSSFPWGTFAVNIIGSFIIGLLYGVAAQGHMPTHWRLLLTTGFCGGFTTFSTFSYENLQYFTGGQYWHFGLYAGLSLVLGLLAVAGGAALGTTLGK